MTMQPTHDYEHIKPGDYRRASPWDLREQAQHEARGGRGGTPERAVELFRLADAKENRLFRDPARMAIQGGFRSVAAYLNWCNVVGLKA
jgi:hypothetical protein